MINMNSPINNNPYFKKSFWVITKGLFGKRASEIVAHDPQHAIHIFKAKYYPLEVEDVLDFKPLHIDMDK